MNIKDRNIFLCSNKTIVEYGLLYLAIVFIVFIRLSAAALFKFLVFRMRRLFEGGAL